MVAANFTASLLVFTVDLLRQLTDDSAFQMENNLVFSPAAITMATGLLFEGSAGDTATQIRKALFSRIAENRLAPIHNGCRRLQRLFTSDSDAATSDSDLAILLANRLYMAKRFELKESFPPLLKKFYGGEVESIDFSESPEASRKQINQWAKDVTQKRVKDVVPQNALDAKTRLVAVNAAYLTGSWKQPFDDDEIQKLPFYSSPGNALTVETMSASLRVPYFDSEELNCQIVALPYSKPGHFLYIFLPNEKHGLLNFVQELTSKRFLEETGQLKLEQVDIELPKFKVDSQIQLNEPLTALGIEDLFTTEADLPKIAEDADDLFLSRFLHRAIVQVDTAGTEGATTETAAAKSTSEFRAGNGIAFQADHPFFFMVVKSNEAKEPPTVLFAGVVFQPHT